MSSKTFKTVSSVKNDYVDFTSFDFSFASSGEYVVDDSHFVPMSEAIHQLGVNSINTVSNLAYDFADGKDNGSELPISRKKGVSLAEISMDINARNESLTEAIKSQQLHEKKIASFEKGLEASSGSSSGSN